MRGIDLLARASEDLRLFNLIKDNYSGDEIELDSMAYHLQQCCEKILKHMLKESGIHYHKTHKMRDLYNYFVQNDLSYPIQLRPYWDHLDEFESYTRYEITIVGNLIVFEELLPILSELLSQQRELQLQRQNRLDDDDDDTDVIDQLNIW